MATSFALVVVVLRLCILLLPRDIGLSSFSSALLQYEELATKLSTYIIPAKID